MTTQRPSALYTHIEKLHADRPWGNLLDAGSGVSSMRWLLSLETHSWTAITGSSMHAQRIRQSSGFMQREQDRLLVANWVDSSLLQDEIYDTVIADYLLGAIEGFAPYFQSYLFSRLRPLTKNWLYVTGCEPYVPTRMPENKAEQIVWEIGRYRDACLLLGGDRPYREYPAHWVVDQLAHSGFKVRSVKHFPIHTGKKFINGQIDLCKPALDSLADQNLANALRTSGEKLRADALASLDASGGVLRAGQDYVISAESV